MERPSPLPAPAVYDADKTLTTPLSGMQHASPPLLGLTLLWHPEPDRAGQQFLGPAGPGEIELNRFLPAFRHPGEEGMPLGHRCIARAPLLIRRDRDDAVTLVPPDSSMAVAVDGERLSGPVTLPAARIARGAVLALGGYVLVCLHWMRRLPAVNPLQGILGVGGAAATLRDEIRQVADTTLPVLLLGETGTGKEVAARAIHAAGRRRERPFVAVNMAALGESLAAADLFGAARGAYTGATVARAGLFAEAADGTLFLDEIGDTPAAVQPMLLRVLETGQYRPLGAAADAQSRARLVTATDRDLNGPAFNQPLLRRIEAFTIRVPPLRERREDIGLLVRHFLVQWCAGTGREVELPVGLVAEMCRHDWPGNVRQLAHAVRRAALAIGAGGVPSLASLLPDAVSGDALPAVAHGAAERRRLADVSEEAVFEAMEANGWQIKAAAAALGISRPSLYKLLKAHPRVRAVESIPADELRRVLAQHAADLRRCASALRTPGEALRRYARHAGFIT